MAGRDSPIPSPMWPTPHRPVNSGDPVAGASLQWSKTVRGLTGVGDLNFDIEKALDIYGWRTLQRNVQL